MTACNCIYGAGDPRCCIHRADKGFHEFRPNPAIQRLTEKDFQDLRILIRQELARKGV